MIIKNEADRVKQEVLARTARQLFADTPDQLDHIPVKMRPKNGTSSRCCIYKDRAAIRYRIMAALGFREESEVDELKSLAEYSREAEERAEIKEPFISILNMGCSACLESQTTVTNLCRGCVARPCVSNCPRNAVTVRNGRAEIDKSLCINCGICAKACSFHAIVQVPLACAEACPVNAISKTEDGKVSIDHDGCIRCGRCQQACPFGAIMSCSQIADVIKLLKSEKEVIALVAPALTGIFPNSRKQLNGALKKLGFSKIYDVAAGADETAAEEARELSHKLDEGQPFMLTSCCPGWIETVERHLPQLKEYVSETPSPMQISAAAAHNDNSDAVLVFIGPCAAKRSEAIRHQAPDYVMTAEELAALFMAKNIDVSECEEIPFEHEGSPDGIGFANSGGVASAVQNQTDTEMKTFKIDGLSKKTINLLKTFALTKQAPAPLVEVMCCEGGCSAGPCSFENPQRAAKRISEVCK